MRQMSPRDLWWLAPVWLVTSFAMVFFNCALAACAQAQFSGEQPDIALWPGAGCRPGAADSGMGIALGYGGAGVECHWAAGVVGRQVGAVAFRIRVGNGHVPGASGSDCRAARRYRIGPAVGATGARNLGRSACGGDPVRVARTGVLPPLPGRGCFGRERISGAAAHRRGRFRCGDGGAERGQGSVRSGALPLRGGRRIAGRLGGNGRFPAFFGRAGYSRSERISPALPCHIFRVANSQRPRAPSREAPCFPRSLAANSL